MGASDYVPIALTRAFREAQADEAFQGWLEMQQAVMGIEFPTDDLPEVRDRMFAKDSLAILEEKLLLLYGSVREALAVDAGVHRTMRYAYYIGETYRRAFEGTWVAISTRKADTVSAGTQPGIELPFRESFVLPVQQIRLALIRRTGSQITRTFDHAERDYASWIEKGRPPVDYVGTLREEA